VEDVSVDELLLILKIAFLVLLYLFIWRIVRSASRDIRLPEESMVLRHDDPRAVALRGGGALPAPRLVVARSTALRPGAEHALNSSVLTIGRSADNDIELTGDDYASSHHARIEPRRDGVWVVDTGSTNGTFVNGIRLERPHRLAPGDVVRVGETDLRFEQ
jgi:FHA domain